MNSSRRLFPTLSRSERSFLAELLRTETVGGALVLAAAAVALVWANSPWSGSYTDLIQLDLGPLNVQHWASDGALALFFYVAGLELKRELVVGSLRNPADAMLPIVGAVCGVATPALVYVCVNALADDGSLTGWAIPAATDIAFALAVLAVAGRGLPTQLRAFLLTLAVVDDLVVIAIIAAFYTDTIDLRWLAATAVLLGVFALLQKIRGESWLWYVPLSLAAWWCMHESGIHATIAGVAMGLLTRVRTDPGEARSPAEALEHKLSPWSAGLAVPFFALTSAGVALTGGDGIWSDPVTWGVLLGLLIGKPVGVLAGTWLVARFSGASLSPDISWRDMTAISILAGVGFTVALLVADLSYDGARLDGAKTAVLAGSLLSAVVASAILARRRRRLG